MKNIFKTHVLVALISIGSVNVFAADVPTVSDAHDMFKSLIVNDLLFADYSRDNVYNEYQGSDCASTLHYIDKSNGKGMTMQIDWSSMRTAKMNEIFPQFHLVELIGFVSYTSAEGSKKYDENKFFAIDEITSKRVVKALNLLIKSCNKGSKFD